VDNSGVPYDLKGKGTAVSSSTSSSSAGPSNSGTSSAGTSSAGTSSAGPNNTGTSSAAIPINNPAGYSRFVANTPSDSSSDESSSPNSEAMDTDTDITNLDDLF
jgi:hypothetical protein